MVVVKQGDASSRYLTVYLKKNNETFIPESGTEFLFRCEKPDGHGVILDSGFKDSELDRFLVINNGDGTLDVELTAQCTTVSGTCRCDICLYKNEQILSTLPFALDVRRSPDATNLAVSSDDFRTLVSRTRAAENLMQGIAQTVATLTLSKNWQGNSSPYTQTVPVTGYTVTRYTKVDLVANPSVIEIMLDSRTDEIMIINDNGVLTAYAIGEKPNAALTVQAGLYETLTI